ncbi:hypothetical protein Tco_0071810 [Tanacetum coccineum]
MSFDGGLKEMESLANWKKVNLRGKSSWVELSKFPGWIPDFNDERGNDVNSVNNNVDPTDLDRAKFMPIVGSIVNFMEQVVKVGQYTWGILNWGLWIEYCETHVGLPKWSKLDRFFVSENLLTSCPNISAITLERFISDSSAYIFYATKFVYWPTFLFDSTKYWLEVDGFDKMVRESWEAAPGNKDNAIRSFMEELRLCDELIDKAKIKWAIEGDENVKFFHGILNKKRSQSQIRGVMANGVWIDDPVKVMRKISSWWNVEYMEVNSYEEWRSWLVSTRIRSNIKVIIEGIYYGLWWVMWNFRNKILFDTKIPEKIKILEARLAMEKNPDDHPCESAAILHELLNEMENLRVE